jgi:hypothetical protein
LPNIIGKKKKYIVLCLVFCLFLAHSCLFITAESWLLPYGLISPMTLCNEATSPPPLTSHSGLPDMASKPSLWEVSSSLHVCLPSLLFFWGWGQGVVLGFARQALYSLSHIPVLLLFMFFFFFCNESDRKVY